MASVKVTKFSAPMAQHGKTEKAHGVCGSSSGPTSIPKESVHGQKSLPRLKKGK